MSGATIKRGALVDELQAQAAHAAELLVAPLEPVASTTARDDGRERSSERRVEQRRGRRRIGVRAADRLGHDLVDDAAGQQVGRGELQRLGGFDLSRRRRATESRRIPRAG